MAVASPQEASVLSNEYTWTILEVLRDAGGQGITPMKLFDKLKEKKGRTITRSKTYALLRELYQNNWVEKGDYVNEVDEKGHKHILKAVAGEIIVNPDFEPIIREKMERYVEKNLIPILLEFARDVVKKLDDDPNTRDWLPDKTKSSYCLNCSGNHEAFDFFDCIISVASTIFQESDEFAKMLIKEKFADKDYI